MPQNQFSGTGIVDGQIVEANQINQSVDAFTGAKDYRITLTGSMELSGSLLMSGSFINEYTGQFSTLGLGVAAPTAPTMLYIKDTSAGGDPAIVMETTTGNDSARVRLKNPDVEYDLGAFGSSGDDFMVVQDVTATPRFPFIVGKDTVSYTLYTSDDSVGVGLGSNTPAILNPLDPGSLQVLGRVSGSSMRADIISASAAGENIHGTASYATYIETAQTASYVKAENVDFYYSISQQINSGGRIAAVTGSFDNAQTDSDSGYSIGKPAGGYTKIISGSAGGNLFFGSVEEQNFIKMTGNGSTIELDSGGEVYLKNDVFTPGTITISGSLSGDRKLVVGPNNTSGTVNARSSSLLVNSLEFNENSEASYVGNFNNSSTAKLRFGAGGDATNYALNISSSRQTEAYGMIAATGQADYLANLGNITPMFKRGLVAAFGGGELDNVEYRGGAFTSFNSFSTYTLFTITPANSDALGLGDPTAAAIRVEVTLLGLRVNSTQGRATSAFLTRNFSYVKYESDGSTPQDPPFAQSTGTGEFSNKSYNGSANITSIKLETDDSGADDTIITCKLLPATADDMNWKWSAKIIRLGPPAF